MIIMVLVAGYLLSRRVADFDKAQPEGHPAHSRTSYALGGPALQPLSYDARHYII
jgi:hypothetical protein